MNEEGRKKGLEDMKEVRRKVAEKWAATGLLDGLKGHITENMAKLFEAQDKVTLPEDSPEVTDKFDTVHFPIAKAVWAKLPADETYPPLAIHVAKQLSGHTIV